VNGNQQHGKCHLFLERHRQQLLRVHGLAALAGASSLMYSSERPNTSAFAKATAGRAGRPHPVLVLVNLGLVPLVTGEALPTD